MILHIPVSPRHKFIEAVRFGYQGTVMDNQSLLIFWMSFPDGGRDPDQQKTTEYSIFHNVDKICMSWSCKIVEYKILTSENLAVPLNKCLKSQKIHQSIDFNEYSVKVRKMWSRKAVEKFWSSTQPLCLEANHPRKCAPRPISLVLEIEYNPPLVHLIIQAIQLHQDPKILALIELMMTPLILK